MLRYIVFILILVIFLFIWFLGGHFVAKGLPILKATFGDLDTLENCFSPINTLFSALAAAGAVYAIISQGKQSRVQQFESVFFSLLNIHRENAQQLSLNINKNEEESSGYKAFHECYLLLKEIFHRASSPEDFDIFFTPNLTVDDYIREQIEARVDENGLINLPKEKLFEISFKTFEQCVDNALNHYFRQLYHLIVYTDSYAPRLRKTQYIRIIRAQLTTFEFVLLYYNALMSKDYALNHSSSKFKLLIERHCLLHNMDKELLFDEEAAGSYKKTATQHRHPIKGFIKKADAFLSKHLSVLFPKPPPNTK